LWLTVEGDLRFLSHRDCARLVERAAIRARLPLRYTQGFNPHPILSLICPRPVGVASRDDLAVAALAAPCEPAGLLDRMNRQVPEGMSFLRAEPLAGKRAPQVLRMRCEMPLAPGRDKPVAARLEAFRGADAWPIERQKRRRRRGQPVRSRRLDLQRLVAEIDLAPGRLAWTLVPDGEIWARPAEVLEAFGLDGREDLATVTRRRIEYDF